MLFDGFNTKYKLACILFTSFCLSACGGSADSTPPPPPKIPPTYKISGAAVKGPLQFANVKVFQFDSTKTDGLGRLLSTSSTDETTKIKDLVIKEEITGYFVVEFGVNDTTIDITTGKSPVFKLLRNIISANDIISNNPVYATPLSTLTLKLAISKLKTESSLENALAAAERDVKSIFGLGIGSDIDLLKIPPILTSETNSAETQSASWATRTANEASAALIYQLYIKIAEESLTIDKLLNDIVHDFSDGSLDAVSGDLSLVYTSDKMSIFNQPISSLIIAGSDSVLITDLKQIMASETSSTGYADVDSTLLIDSDLFVPRETIILDVDVDQDGISNSEDLDNDNDGYEDKFDIFPLDSSEWSDNDLDGKGDNADTDDDNDGVLDDVDAFPFDVNESEDFDGDGIGNNADTDDDNDGVADELDAFPFDVNESEDFDGDGIGNNADLDDDNDGVSDDVDVFPFDANESADFDGDGIGNNADTDDDNDGVLDDVDAFPFDVNESEDFDGDGIGNNADLDDDNDGFLDTVDTFPFDKTEWEDSDGDGKGNNFDSDDDNDGVLDNDDAFPFDPSETKDFDNDGLGDNTDQDDDNDGIIDELDNITLGSVKTSYLTGEQININVRAKDNDNTILKSSDGWHVQYYTYDLANPVNSDPESANTPEQFIRKYTEDGYYNGYFNQQTNEWLVQFPALDYAGTFKTRISIYCSRGDKMCGGQLITSSDSWDQEFTYTVECASDGTCEYVPETEPGVNITNNAQEADVYSIVLRSNGQLVTSYRLFSPTAVFNAISNSNNLGESWQVASTLQSFNGAAYAYLYEDSKDNLMMVTQCALDLCIVKFDQNMQWIVVSRIDMSKYKICDAFGCSVANLTATSIIEGNDGSYLLSYNVSIGNSSQVDIFTIKSDDLVVWSDPYQVSGYQDFDFDSKLIQLADGRYLMAYVSYDNNAIVITLSDDGETWKESQKISTNTHLDMNISLIKEGNSVRIFYTSFSYLYSHTLGQNDTFSSPTLIRNNIKSAPIVVKLPDSTFGILYSLYLNEKRDVFFENIGTIAE
jgi:hypothetical protein